MPNLPALTLNGKAQTLTATMPNFAVSLGILDISGVNITVAGDSSAAHSAVFKVSCPGPGSCGSDAAGYVTGGATLPSDSLTFSTSGASWNETSGLGGSVPSFLCAGGCQIDQTTPVKVASQAAGIGVLATWTASGFSASSVSLAVPTTVRKPSQPGEVYRVDLVWTLGSGP